MNDTDYYTVFDLPISVSNGIEVSDDRADCGVLENKLLSSAEVAKSNGTLSEQPWVDGVDSGSNSGSAASHSRTGLKRWLLVALLGVMGMVQLQ